MIADVLILNYLNNYLLNPRKQPTNYFIHNQPHFFSIKVIFIIYLVGVVQFRGVVCVCNKR